LSQRRIVFVRTDRLGETLLNLPAIHALRQAYPDAHLTLLIHPSLQELLAGHPDVSAVVAEPMVSGSWWRRVWHLGWLWRSWHPDLIMLSNPKKEYHAGAWLAGIPQRVGWNRKWGWLLTHRLQDQKRLGERHEVEYNFDLLEALGISAIPEPIPWLPIDQQAEDVISQLLGQVGVAVNSQLVAVHPWTSNPRKQWPVERFRSLIRQVAQRAGVTPVVIGGQEEQARVAELGNIGEGTEQVLNLVGRCSLRELAALLRRVRALVSNDSGPMHLAAAVGTPVIALFGTAEPGSHPRRWGPWGSGHTVIHKPLHEITVDEALQALRRYL